jgi:hypothetical protein
LDEAGCRRRLAREAYGDSSSEDPISIGAACDLPTLEVGGGTGDEREGGVGVRERDDRSDED